jgi:hypothetical protein
MSGELKERNILKLILIVRFACATLDVGHPIRSKYAVLPFKSGGKENKEQREGRVKTISRYMQICDVGQKREKGNEWKCNIGQR